MKTVRITPGHPTEQQFTSTNGVLCSLGKVTGGPHSRQPPSLRPRASLTCRLGEFGRWLSACPDPRGSSLNPRDTRSEPARASWHPRMGAGSSPVAELLLQAQIRS